MEKKLKQCQVYDNEVAWSKSGAENNGRSDNPMGGVRERHQESGGLPQF